MGDTKPGSPFAGLDKALLRSTRPGEMQPASQQATPPARQDAGKPVKQDAAKPGSQLVKATFYLSEEHLMKLEHLRLERRQHGQRIDKSALIREAIDLITSKPG